MQDIFNAEDGDHAMVAAKAFQIDYGTKFPKAAAKITDDLDVLLEFYNHPAKHWVHLRTTDENVQHLLDQSGAVCWEHPAAAAVRRPAAAVKLERPAGRTTLTAARTGVGWSAVGAVDRRSEEHGLGLEAVPRCLALSA
jgi:transposase-like protein